jgi:hypothetical protein
MQARESADSLGTARPHRPRLFRKTVPDGAPVTARSTALFRFGEQCNNHCPMCSNTGEAALFYHSTDELLRRAAFLHDCGFRRVVVTGGEATIHPGFWTIVEQLAAYGMAWDTNTHGRSFAKPGFAERAVATGLRRAIVSLHSLHPPTSAAIFGASEAAHHETVEGIERLLAARVAVMVNCVLTELNVAELEQYLQLGATRFPGATFKFVFPSTIGKGGRWPGVATLRYDAVRETVARLRALGAQLDVRLFFESFPSCLLGDAAAVNLGRSAWGESHYLDDATGDRIYTMRHIEAELSAYADVCRQCTALRRCPGIAREYVKRHGVGELMPFAAEPREARRHG